MAKKHLGRIITFAAVAGAAMGAVSYFLRYKSFHKELDEEFHDFEDEFEEFHDEHEESSTATRTYVSLTPDRPTQTEKTSAEPMAEPMAEKSTTDEKSTTGEKFTTGEASEEASADATTIVEDTTA